MKDVLNELKEFVIEEARRSPIYLALNTFIFGTATLLAIYATGLLVTALVQ